MTTWIAIGIAAVVAALAFMVWIFVTAPEGWEDEDTGFHLGRPEDDQ